MTTGDATRQIAMLIDGDNAQPSLLDRVLAETVKYGFVTTRRIYGDWTEPTMRGWKDALHTYAVQPIQQFRYTTGKNATDSALIIDAMDLLHSGAVSGFCIVSSDSDYTRLATRVRETGLFVMGIGRSDTPRSFVNACQVFVYTENLIREEAVPAARRKGSTDREPVEIGAPEVVLRAIELAAQEDGFASLGAVGNHVRQLDPGFDPRSYGFKQLSLLIKAFPASFEVRQTKAKGGPTQMHVRVTGTEV
ncbi:MAG: NYN domain-containing protein [Chloroflexi bacterium]|nr:NYN domain-containing protein [Chloroflexota bacterium]